MGSDASKLLRVPSTCNTGPTASEGRLGAMRNKKGPPLLGIKGDPASVQEAIFFGGTAHVSQFTNYCED